LEALEVIFKRKSTRKFTNKEISEENLNIILKAAMASPSCANTRDWQFIVVRDKETLAKMADANGRPAQVLKEANVGILICGDEQLAFSSAKEYWVIDGAIATENMCVAATALGIGNVWLGTWPQMERVNNQKALFNLPDHIIPHSILALGYPLDEEAFIADNSGWKFEESKIHYEKW
jgi:nitroreductase